MFLNALRAEDQFASDHAEHVEEPAPVGRFADMHLFSCYRTDCRKYKTCIKHEAPIEAELYEVESSVKILIRCLDYAG